jgi:hypothetical protein
MEDGWVHWIQTETDEYQIWTLDNTCLYYDFMVKDMGAIPAVQAVGDLVRKEAATRIYNHDRIQKLIRLGNAMTYISHHYIFNRRY